MFPFCFKVIDMVTVVVFLCRPRRARPMRGGGGGRGCSPESGISPISGYVRSEHVVNLLAGEPHGFVWLGECS